MDGRKIESRQRSAGRGVEEWASDLRGNYNQPMTRSEKLRNWPD